MRLRFLSALSCLLLIVSCGPTETKKIERPNEADVFEMDAADPEMQVAVADAKASLKDFDAALKSRSKAFSHFAVKQSFPIPEGREEMWIGDITLHGSGYSGTLLNQPLHAKNLKKGDDLFVEREEVIDWMYVAGDTLRGGFTKRLLRSRLSDKDKAKFDRETEYVVEDYRK